MLLDNYIIVTQQVQTFFKMYWDLTCANPYYTYGVWLDHLFNWGKTILIIVPNYDHYDCLAMLLDTHIFVTQQVQIFFS